MDSAGHGGTPPLAPPARAGRGGTTPLAPPATAGHGGTTPLAPPATAGHGGTTPLAPPATAALARQACVDLGAISGNGAALCERVRGSQVMAVVQADGYGHGIVPAAPAALARRPTRLGAAA